MTRKKALELFTELSMNTQYPEKGVLFDLMVPMMYTSHSHCSTCNCEGYVTYTGYSLRPTSKEMIEKIRNMTTRQHKEFVAKNTKLIVKD